MSFLFRLAGALLGIAPCAAALAVHAEPADAFRQIALGRNHFCAVTAGGALACWGDDRNGQIGNGLDRTRALKPTLVIDREVAQVSTGYAHTCAVVGDALDCWGWAETGQLGIGKAAGNVTTPRRVIAAGVTAVSAGGMHTCALVAGALQCWGYNASGQIGTGKAGGNQLTPITVIAQGVTGFSAGAQHTCAVVREALQCWGANRRGQIGTGVAGAAVPAPTTVIAKGVTAVAAGSDYTCAVAEGALWCWGANDETGIGPNAKGKVHQPRQVIARGVTAVAAGAAHTCAIVNGGLQCWGYNSSSVFGGKWGEVVLTPREVITRGVTAAAAGEGNTCVIVDGGLRCRGHSPYGQIADMEPDHLKPFEVGAHDAKTLDLRAAQAAARVIGVPKRIAADLIGRIIVDQHGAYTVVETSSYFQADTETMRLFLSVFPIVDVMHQGDPTQPKGRTITVAPGARCGGTPGNLATLLGSTSFYVLDQGRLLDLAQAMHDRYDVLPQMQLPLESAHIEADDLTRLQECARIILAAAEARPYARLRFTTELMHDVPPTPDDGHWIVPRHEVTKPVEGLWIFPRGEHFPEGMSADIQVNTVARCADGEHDERTARVSAPWLLRVSPGPMSIDRRLLDNDLPYAVPRAHTAGCQRVVTSETYTLRQQGKVVQQFTVPRSAQPVAGSPCEGDVPLLALHVANDLGHAVLEEGERYLVCKAAPDRPDRSYVALAVASEQTKHSDDGGMFDLEVAIVDSASSKVISHLRTEGALTSDAIGLTGITLDTAPYTLAPGVRAFGVRARHQASSHVYSYSSETLNLYAQHGGQLKAVLTGLVTAENHSSDAEGDCAGYVETIRTVQIDRSSNHGLADLLVKTTTVTHQLAQVNEECVEKSAARATEQHRWQFDGQQYKSAAPRS